MHDSWNKVQINKLHEISQKEYHAKEEKHKDVKASNGNLYFEE